MRTPGVTALGLGAMIGAGIFVLTGMAAGKAGPALILAFALNGAVALIVGACYAELATMMPKAGGAYVWAKAGLGNCFGFFAGWMSAFAQLIACALYAAAFGSFTRHLLSATIGIAPGDWLGPFATVSVLLVILVTNYRGAVETGRLGLVVTGLKVAILFVVVVFGLWAIFSRGDGLAAFTPFFPEGIGGLVSAMGITFVAFEGYEIIVQSGEEVKRPGATIPRAIFLSIAIAVALYLLVATVLLGAVTPPPGQALHAYLGELKELGLMEAAGQFVPYGKLLLLIAGLASTASALNATVYGSSRIVFAMGRAEDLPALLGRVHRVRQTPYLALGATGTLMAVVAVFLPIEDIAAGANIMFLLVFIMVCATVIRLRRLRPERTRPFVVPLSPWLPALGIITGLGLAFWLLKVSLIAWGVAAGWLLLGGGVFYYQQQANRPPDRDA